MKKRIVSPTWEAMDEKRRDGLRASFRRMVAGMMEGKEELSPAERRIVEAMDACLMEDRIELGSGIAGLLALDDLGASDISSLIVGQLFEQVDPVGCRNPLLN